MTTIGGNDGRNVVLLGASNLTISFPLIVSYLRTGFSGSLKMYAAMGHGRSFGIWSRIFHRSLPGITVCPLWDDLARDPSPDQPLTALITDVGNDLMYGVPPAQIAEWIDLCLQRLTERRAEIVMTLLPMASVRRLTQLHYTCARTVLFPKCRICWPDMQARADELGQRLQELAVRYQVQTVEPPLEWYGLDPIHVRSASRVPAWGSIFSRWTGFDAGTAPPPLPQVVRFRLWNARPALRRVLGKPQGTPQPAIQLDRMTVSLY